MNDQAPPPLDEARVRALRAQLPTLDTSAYLNAGTLGPMPQVAIAAMHAALDREAHDRQPPTIWSELDDAQQRARAAAAALGGVAPSQVALSHTTHEGISACLWGIDLEPGDNLVTSDEEHPGVLVPLRVARERRGAELRMVRWHPDPAAFAAAIAERVDARTAAVVVSHVSWLSGSIADLHQLRAAIGDVPLIVDGAQGAGAMPVAVGPGAADAYTVSGQKWPLGPNGSGGVLLADPERWRAAMPGFFSVADMGQPLDSPWQPDGRRLEHSQESLLPLVGFAAAAGWLASEVGVAAAHERSRELNMRARELLGPCLEAIAGDRAGEGPVLSGDAHLLAAHVEPGTAESIARALLERGVSIRNLGPDVIRFSLGFWTTDADLHAAREALEDLRSGPR